MGCQGEFSRIMLNYITLCRKLITYQVINDYISMLYSVLEGKKRRENL